MLRTDIADDRSRRLIPKYHHYDVAQSKAGLSAESPPGHDHIGHGLRRDAARHFGEAVCCPVLARIRVKFGATQPSWSRRRTVGIDGHFQTPEYRSAREAQ